MSQQHIAHGHMAHGQAGHDHAAMVADFRHRFWVSMIITIPVLALSPLVQNLLGLRETLAFSGDSYVLFGLSAVVYFYCGWPFLKGIYDEVSERRPGMMTLIAVAISTAFFYSSAVVFGLPGTVFFWELATLIDVMLLGHWLEMKSVLGASRALEALVQLLPATAHRLTANDDAEDVSIADLKPGDRVLVKPGERVPVDGVITKGHSSFNESMLTGESRPVEKAEGQEAVGGAVNGEGAVVLVVRKTGDQTYLSQVVALVKQAQETRSRTQDLADRAALWLTYIALSVGGATLVAWLGFGFGFDYAIERMATVMVIASTGIESLRDDASPAVSCRVEDALRDLSVLFSRGTRVTGVDEQARRGRREIEPRRELADAGGASHREREERRHVTWTERPLGERRAERLWQRGVTARPHAPGQRCEQPQHLSHVGFETMRLLQSIFKLTQMIWTAAQLSAANCASRQLSGSRSVRQRSMFAPWRMRPSLAWS